jgi:hypothetical protein
MSTERMHSSAVKLTMMVEQKSLFDFIWGQNGREGYTDHGATTTRKFLLNRQNIHWNELKDVKFSLILYLKPKLSKFGTAGFAKAKISRKKSIDCFCARRLFFSLYHG